MAVQSNSSEVEVAGGVQLFTGIFPFSVVAVNPTLAELQDMGIQAKKDPDYTVTIQDQEYNKVVFWCKNPDKDFLVKFEVLMQPNPRQSKDGAKFMWVNNIGQTTWSADVPAYDWWKNPEQSRKAYVGEDALINFTKAWANVANGGEVSFDTIDAIAKGDVKELREYVKILGANQLRLLIGVKDGKYQVVYNRHFGRMKPVRDDLFFKALNEDYGSFNAEFNPDLKPQTYSPSLITADETVAEEVAAGSDKDVWEE